MGEQFFIFDNILSPRELCLPFITAGTVFALFTENRYRMRAGVTRGATFKGAE
jgi:hypothetical protein